MQPPLSTRFPRRFRLCHQAQQYGQRGRLAIEAIRAELIPKIKALCPGPGPKLKTLPPPRPAVRARPRSKHPIDIVAIGTSTGGPNALARSPAADIRQDFPVPIVVVQHMPPIFTRLLAERLAQPVQRFRLTEGARGTSLSTPDTPGSRREIFT